MGKLSNFNSETENQQEELMNKYNEYKNMSESQISGELFKEVQRQKNNGTFDYEKLEKMVESLKDNLPEENYNNIKRILQSIKWNLQK